MAANLSVVQNLKASSVSSIVMWLACIVCVLIIYMWYSSNIGPLHINIEQSTTDLNNILTMINDACINTFYSNSYNPITESGQLLVENNKLCINSSKTELCRIIICDTNLTTEINLDNIVYINIIKYTNSSFSIYGDKEALNQMDFINATKNASNSS